MTLDEIAKLAGVSKTTASYVINGKASQYRISERTQQKVLAIVTQHNYQPNHAATSLRAGHTRSFGLIIPDLENTSYARLAKLLEQNSRKAGYQILIACSDDDPQTEQTVAHALISRRIDALFVASCLSSASDFYLKIQGAGTPIIAIDRPMDDEYFCCVVSEDFDAAHELTRSLIQQNIGKIGLIGAMRDLTVSKERELGFHSACSQAGIDSCVGYGDYFTRESAQQIIGEWIINDQLPDAIVTTSYTLLEGVLDQILKHPDIVNRVKLATFGDNRLLDFLPIKINSLPQQFELIADNALQFALNACSGDYHKGMVLIPRILSRRQ